MSDRAVFFFFLRLAGAAVMQAADVWQRCALSFNLKSLGEDGYMISVQNNSKPLIKFRHSTFEYDETQTGVGQWFGYFS